MASPFKFEDFEKDDIVYYVPKHLQPKDDSSPLFKNCQEGIVSGLRYPNVFVKYIHKGITQRTGSVNYNHTAQQTKPEDLWK